MPWKEAGQGEAYECESFLLVFQNQPPAVCEEKPELFKGEAPACRIFYSLLVYDKKAPKKTGGVLTPCLAISLCRMYGRSNVLLTYRDHFTFVTALKDWKKSRYDRKRVPDEIQDEFLALARKDLPIPEKLHKLEGAEDPLRILAKIRKSLKKQKKAKSPTEGSPLLLGFSPASPQTGKKIEFIQLTAQKKAGPRSPLPEIFKENPTQTLLLSFSPDSCREPLFSKSQENLAASPGAPAPGADFPALEPGSGAESASSQTKDASLTVITMKKNKNTGLPKAIFLSAHEKKKAELVLPGLEEIPAVNSSNASSGHSAPPENQAAKKPSRRGAAKSKKETPPTEKARHWKNFTYDLPPPPRPHAKKAGKREVGALLKDPRASHASAASGSGFKKKALIAGGTIALLGVTAILTLPLTSDEPREMASEAKVPSEENKTALAVKPTQDPLAYKREGIGDKAIPETLPEAAAKLFAAAEAAEEEKPALPSLASYRMFIPKKGRDLVHTLPEIRWCLREGIILDLLAAKLPASEFDVQAKPFNERCLNYRYFESDMDHARKDVEDIEGTIREEALKRADLRGTAVLEETGNKKLTEKDEVVYVQELLVRLGFGLRIDGVLGARTVKAIKRIQSKAGMELTGTVSARLIQELEKIISQ